MVIDFPSFPLDGELHTVNGIVYRYSSAIGAWLINADGVTNTLLVANTLTVNTSVIVGSINVEPTIITDENACRLCNGKGVRGLELSL